MGYIVVLNLYELIKIYSYRWKKIQSSAYFITATNYFTGMLHITTVSNLEGNWFQSIMCGCPRAIDFPTSYSGFIYVYFNCLLSSLVHSINVVLNFTYLNHVLTEYYILGQASKKLTEIVIPHSLYHWFLVYFKPLLR